MSPLFRTPFMTEMTWDQSLVLPPTCWKWSLCLCLGFTWRRLQIQPFTSLSLLCATIHDPRSRELSPWFGSFRDVLRWECSNFRSETTAYLKYVKQTEKKLRATRNRAEELSSQISNAPWSDDLFVRRLLDIGSNWKTPSDDTWLHNVILLTTSAREKGGTTIAAVTNGIDRRHFWDGYRSYAGSHSSCVVFKNSGWYRNDMLSWWGLYQIAYKWVPVGAFWYATRNVRIEICAVYSRRERRSCLE